MNISACAKIFTKAFLILVNLISLLGCNSNSDEENLTYVTLNTSLINSSKVMDDHNNSVRHAILEKLKDYETMASTERWYPKAETANRVTNSLCEYISNFRKQFELESGVIVTETKKNYENLDEATSKKFYEKGFYKELMQRLITFKDSITNIDSELTKLFYEYMSPSLILDTTLQTRFYNYYFKNKSALATIATITAFANDAKRIETFAINFFFRKCPTYGDYYETFYALASQTSTYVQKGDKIEITAGVGTFSLKAKPNITINNKHIDINPDGVAVYKFKSSSKPGKHYVPISIEFTKPDEQKIKLEKTIEYTVAE